MKIPDSHLIPMCSVLLLTHTGTHIATSIQREWETLNSNKHSITTQHNATLNTDKPNNSPRLKHHQQLHNHYYFILASRYTEIVHSIQFHRWLCSVSHKQSKSFTLRRTENKIKIYAHKNGIPTQKRAHEINLAYGSVAGFILSIIIIKGENNRKSSVCPTLTSAERKANERKDTKRRGGTETRGNVMLFVKYHFPFTNFFSSLPSWFLAVI